VENEDTLPELTLFPHTAATGIQGHLAIGGCDTVALAATYGTPLYIFDETTLRAKCSEFRREFRERYPDTLAIYACKAFTSQAFIRLIPGVDPHTHSHVATSVLDSKFGFPIATGQAAETGSPPRTIAGTCGS
jgi:diaminopimelate decarboxylase